jgi:soluble lytic murein transglycosylase-like protein
MDYSTLDRYRGHIGRTKLILRLCSLFLSVAFAALHGAYARPAAAPNPANIANEPSSVTKAPETAAAQQSASITAMAACIDKQKASARSQVGSAAQGDAFFTVPWITPAEIPAPAVVPACDPVPEDDLQNIISAAAKTQAIKPELIRAVIRRESDSYPCAVSEKGALGLMQLMPDVAQQFGVDPLDAKQNVDGGTRYLKQLMSRYKGDLKLALAAYNAGPQRVDAEKKVPDIPETTAYVDSILKDLTANAPSPPVSGR